VIRKRGEKRMKWGGGCKEQLVRAKELRSKQSGWWPFQTTCHVSITCHWEEQKLEEHRTKREVRVKNLASEATAKQNVCVPRGEVGVKIVACEATEKRAVYVVVVPIKNVCEKSKA
jgi:hypothetical protein